MKMIEDFKEDINKSLKEIRENRDEHVDALKKKTHKKCFQEVQENTVKQVKDLNKTVQDLKL